MSFSTDVHEEHGEDNFARECDARNVGPVPIAALEAMRSDGMPSRLRGPSALLMATSGLHYSARGVFGFQRVEAIPDSDEILQMVVKLASRQSVQIVRDDPGPVSVITEHLPSRKVRKPRAEFPEFSADREQAEPVRAWVQDLASAGAETAPAKSPALKLEITTDPNGIRRWRATRGHVGRALEATTQDDVSAFSGCAVSLKKHSNDVRDWACAFGRAAGLQPELASDLSLAAALHDMGKAHERFQVLLHGGDEVAALGDETLAKSRQSGSYVQRARATARSGWSAGMRHELLSLLSGRSSSP